MKIVTTLTVPVFTMGVAGLSAPSERLTFPRAAAACYMLILIAVSPARGEGTSSIWSLLPWLICPGDQDPLRPQFQAGPPFPTWAMVCPVGAGCGVRRSFLYMETWETWGRLGCQRT